MSKIDYQALRAKAVKAGKDKWQAKKINGDFFVIRHGSYTRQHGYTSYQPIAEIDCKPVRDFVAKANPATVLELLDELEAAKKRIAELEAEPVSQAYKLNQLSGNSLVTPDSWISCSERMPNDKQYVWCWGKSYGWTECNTFEGYYDWSRNKWWAVTDDGEEPASKVTHWMPLPEPPQEVNRG
ncbi:TPA: DUF551 domain-containing protein [Escherichia coli]|nr:DUF551 domain-containing protein [Escherichia coli]